MASTLFAQAAGWRRSQLIICTHRQRGIGLLEVLIALLLLSVGVLGATLLQLTALGYTTSAAHTTQASFIAYDMLDRMRANTADLPGYAVSVAPGCNNSLTAPDILATDRQDFVRAVSCLLPRGYGEITINDNHATVTIGWSEARIVAGSSTEFSVSSRMVGEL